MAKSPKSPTAKPSKQTAEVFIASLPKGRFVRRTVERIATEKGFDLDFSGLLLSGLLVERGGVGYEGIKSFEVA